MRKRKTWLYSFIIILVAGISIVLYIQSQPKQHSPSGSNYSSEPQLKFEVIRETINHSIEVKGKSTYAEETRVYAPFSGTIKEWVVKDGSEVKQGDLLFEMEHEHLQKELVLKQANYDKLELEKKLSAAKEKIAGNETMATGGIGEEEAFNRYAQAESKQLEKQMDAIQSEMLRGEIDEINRLLSQARFVSPKTGIFLFYDEKEPKSAAELMPIGKIVDLTKLEMVTTVGEYEVFKLKEGMKVDIQIDALPLEKLKGTVTHVSKFAKNTESREASQFPVIIDLEPHEQLIAGLSLTGSIVTDYKENVLVLPTITVQKDGDTHFVYVWKEDGVERRNIKVGLETADHTEVLEGLQEGDWVILQ